MKIWNFSAYFKVARNALTSDLEYRSNYYIMILSSFITVAMEIAVFRQIFKHTDQAGDIKSTQALSFIVLGMLLRTGSVIWTLVREAIDQIRDGSFRRFLLQPVHYPSFFIAQAVGPKTVTWLLCVLTVAVLKFVPGFESLLPPGSWSLFAIALAYSYVLTAMLYLMMVYLGFFFEEATFLLIAYNIGIGFFSGSMIPVSWLPPLAGKVLSWTPFLLVGDFPIRAGLGILTTDEAQHYIASGTLWIGFFFVLNAVLRQRSFKAYESYGG